MTFHKLFSNIWMPTLLTISRQKWCFKSHKAVT